MGKNSEGNHLSFDDAERLASDVARGARVYVSSERTWLAIAGHEPDETKVLPTEFALLSIIASQRASGIPQTDLARLSGQDKRSVPKRTDRLHAKGYIQKRAIQLKATRTSLCTLGRFLKPEYLASHEPTDLGFEETIQEDRVIDFNVFTDKLFEILREHKIISRDDLKNLLCFSDRWRWKALSRALRKFERIGVLKRVKAMSQYQDTMYKFRSCVMLLREPSKKDFELFHEFGLNLFTNMGQKEDVDEPDEDLEEENERDISSATNEGTVGMIKREESVEESGRPLPTWTPDQNFHRLIFDAIDKAGKSGITNHVSLACSLSIVRIWLRNNRVLFELASEHSSADHWKTQWAAWLNAGNSLNLHISATWRSLETRSFIEPTLYTSTTPPGVSRSSSKRAKHHGRRLNSSQRTQVATFVCRRLMQFRNWMNTDFR